MIEGPMITIDGSQGEGGGQILRTSLSLSLLTGEPVELRAIRAGRARPGLQRQHLAAVKAAQAVGEARVEGASLGASTLSFRPSRVVGGEHRFTVGTAGSATLVAQTVLPALLIAREPSRLTLEGGTHNPLAPPFEFLAETYLPLVEQLGARVSSRLERPGFYPAGGGRFELAIDPAPALGALSLLERGGEPQISAEAHVAGVRGSVAVRELARLRERLGWDARIGKVKQLEPEVGPGNVVLVRVASPRVTEIFVSFGERGVLAEHVADRLADEVTAYLATDAPVGPHLADQLLLLLALGSGGAFRTTALTPHARTQMEVIPRFLDGVRFSVFEESAYVARVEVQGAQLRGG